MDTEKFILNVQKRRSLWDPTHKHYHNRDFARKNWMGLAEEMDESCVFLKGKWRGLRDTFRKELVKTNKHADDPEGAKYISKWRFFETMMFLKDTMTNRAGNLVQKETVETLYDNESSNTDFDDSVSDPLNVKFEFEEMSNDVSQAAVSTKRRNENSNSDSSTGKKNKMSADERLNTVEEKFQKLKENVMEKSQDCDDNYYFLMSLLPYMKTVPEERRLPVRMKIQQILLEEQPFFENNNQNC